MNASSPPVSRDKLRAEYRSHWEAELKRRDQLNQAIGLPITLITGLGGAGYIFVQSLEKPLTGASLLILLMVILSWLALSGAVIKLMQMVFGHDYAYLPTPKSFEENRAQLEKFYLDQKTKKEAEEIDAEIYDRLNARYIEDTEQNAGRNDIRSKHIYDCKKLIVVALALIVVAGATKAMQNLSLNDVRAAVCTSV